MKACFLTNIEEQREKTRIVIDYPNIAPFEYSAKLATEMNLRLAC
jgi:hypothetical protein